MSTPQNETAVAIRMQDSDLDRFWKKIILQPNGCLIWTGAIVKGGYGNMRWKQNGKWSMESTHRLAYEYYIGPIPKGLELDHLCRNRACCNPLHLEPVTRKENQRRGIGNAAKTHCRNGHAYDDANTHWKINSSGYLSRDCRMCDRLRHRRIK